MDIGCSTMAYISSNSVEKWTWKEVTTLTTPLTVQVAHNDAEKIKVTQWINATVILQGNYTLITRYRIFSSDRCCAWITMIGSTQSIHGMEDWSYASRKSKINGKFVRHMIKCSSSMISRRNEVSNDLQHATTYEAFDFRVFLGKASRRYTSSCIKIYNYISMPLRYIWRRRAVFNANSCRSNTLHEPSMTTPATPRLQASVKDLWTEFKRFATRVF